MESSPSISLGLIVIRLYIQTRVLRSDRGTSDVPVRFPEFHVPHRPVNTRPQGMLRPRRAGCSTLQERLFD
jgi:hypothetical protein